MPLFDFKCTSCADVQEHIVSSSEVKEVQCRVCGQKAVQQISAPSPIFSGAGWFRDGYTKP